MAILISTNTELTVVAPKIILPPTIKADFKLVVKYLAVCFGMWWHYLVAMEYGSRVVINMTDVRGLSSWFEWNR